MTKYLEPTNKHWACDLESDDLLDKATKIHCVCVENVLTGEKHDFEDKESFIAWLRADNGIILVGHNFMAFDVVMLNRHWDARIRVSQVVDTFILSQLYNPVYSGGHGLSAWGDRLRFPKTSHVDFSTYTPEMLEYCRNDTSLTARLYIKLSERMRQTGFTEDGCELEHLAWNIVQNKQRKYGFPFDYKKALGLYTSLRQREEGLKDEIYKLWPPELRVVEHFKRGRKLDGSYSAQYIRHKAQYPKLEFTGTESEYRAYDFVAFNLGSPKQRIEKLLELGWEPTQFTPKGSPKVDEDSLLDFAESSGKAEVSALAKWVVINSRANMIRTWMDAYNPKTHAIHGKLYLASTLRYRHNSPNSANIPAVRTDKEGRIKYGEEGAYTYECRDLWTCGNPVDYRLVGIDGKGIQLRVLANYAYSEEFVKSVLDGDPHTNNIKILGLANKAAAKKFFYTLIMGGAGARLAADQAAFGTKLTPKQGSALKEKMIASIPGFKELIKELERELEKTGRIRLCDGTPILVPSPHMVIPYLLQGDESRLMKRASIFLDADIRRNKWDAKKVADIHDEWQYVVHKTCLTAFSEAALRVFPLAGEYYDYKVPIEGSIKDGLTWASTH